MTENSQVKPTKYYIDFENVHGAGLKGIDALDERDEVLIFYSQAAETFHIEHAIDILNSRAHVQFIEIDGGTRNAADFQLIVALFGDMDESFDYAIVSGDTGFDAAIRMGERMGKPAVRRLGNIQGDEAEPEKPKSRRSRRSRSSRDVAKDVAEIADDAEAVPDKPAAGEAAEPDKAPEEAPAETEATPDAEGAVDQLEAQTTEQAAEQKPSSSRRRPRRRKRNGSPTEEQAGAQDEADQAEGSSSNGGSASDDAAAAPAGEDAKAAEALKQEPDRTEKESSKAAGAKKPRKGSAKRVSTRKETDAAYARAAEAMRLALESAAANDTATIKQADPAPAATEASSPEAAPTETPGLEADSPKEGQPEEKNPVALVKALLDEKGVTLTDKQVATVASALEGPGGRQGFYRRIIKIERQQNGRALYHLVRDHYNSLVEAVNA